MFFNRYKRSFKPFEGQEKWFYFKSFEQMGTVVNITENSTQKECQQKNSLSCYKYSCSSNTSKNKRHN